MDVRLTRISFLFLPENPVPSHALRARLRHAAVHSALFSALAVGATAAAAGASAADGASARPVSVTSGTHATTTSAASRAHTTGTTPAPVGQNKVFGMPAPATPEQAKNDDQMLAWTLKHSTASERRDIAAGLGIAYPAAVDLLGSTCDKGQGYVGLWVINFSTKQAHWNVTLDGVGYAGATVLAQSLDFGAIGVPNGSHTIAFVNPSTGAVGATMHTNLHCGTTAPVVTKPKPVVTKPVVTKPVVSKPVVAKPVAKPHPRPAAHRPARPAPLRPAPHHHHRAGTRPAAPVRTVLGPKVQADFVAAPTSQGVSPLLAASLLGAIAGSLVLARRFMRV